MKRRHLLLALSFISASILTACTDLLVVAGEADAVFVEADSAELAIGYAPGDSESHVTGNLTLPTAVLETTIVWVSDNPTVASPAGIVSRPVFDADSCTLNLSAVITAGNKTRPKSFSITVIPLEPTDAQAIGTDALALDIILSGADSETFLTHDIVLPLTGLWGTTIAWASDKPGIISASGDVMSSASDETVTMTATVSRGDGVSETKEFTFIVKAVGSALITIALPVAPTAAELVFRDGDDAAITAFTVYRGSTVTITTSFAGSYVWYVDSSSSSLSSASSCSLVGNLYALGFHTLVLDAASGGKSYSGQIVFKVVTP